MILCKQTLIVAHIETYYIIILGITLNILGEIYLDRMDLFQHDMMCHIPKK